MQRLAELWMDMPAPEVLRRVVPKVIVRISNPQIELILSEDTAKRVKEIIQAKNDVDNWLAAIVLAKCGKLLPDDELRNMAMEYGRTTSINNESFYRFELDRVKELLGIGQ
jgi:hydroxymethylpyrimidine/phosphomethylpyrimidine kinase